MRFPTSTGMKKRQQLYWRPGRGDTLRYETKHAKRVSREGSSKKKGHWKDPTVNHQQDTGEHEKAPTRRSKPPQP